MLASGLHSSKSANNIVAGRVQRVREDMRESEGSCVQYTASSEPASPCGGESTETGRTVEDPGLFCETVAWQWEELGDGNRAEFAVNGCRFVYGDEGQDGEARKGNSLAPGQAPSPDPSTEA